MFLSSSRGFPPRPTLLPNGSRTPDNTPATSQSPLSGGDLPPSPRLRSPWLPPLAERLRAQRALARRAVPQLDGRQLPQALHAVEPRPLVPACLPRCHETPPSRCANSVRAQTARAPHPCSLRAGRALRPVHKGATQHSSPPEHPRTMWAPHRPCRRPRPTRALRRCPFLTFHTRWKGSACSPCSLRATVRCRFRRRARRVRPTTRRETG